MRPNHPAAPSTAARFAHLADPEVLGAIAVVLHGRGVAYDDIPDLTHDVIVRALASRAEPPGLEDCKGLACKIAREVAIDAYRRRRRRGSVNVDMCDEPDEYPATGPIASDAASANEQLDFIHDQLDRGRISALQLRAFALDAEGLPHAAIAEELDVGRSTVSNQLSEGRRRLRASWAAFAAVGLLVAFGLALWKAHERAREAKKMLIQPGPDPSGGPRFTPMEIARGFRARALEACDVGRYEECISDLDRAARLDPAGDESPVVRATRRMVAIKTAPPIEAPPPEYDRK